MSATAALPGTLGVVVIGRNEGERLRRCLESLHDERRPIVYVDSGSTDDSEALSRAMGVTVVALDLATPFTAARARNAGFQRLLALRPELEFVFFVDGDCEVVADWLATATQFLTAHPDVAVACGRRRERHPDRSVYNMLCDLEWDTPVGEASACGGDALMRVAAFRQVGGFNPELICGEEPELCVRFRQKSWRIWRLADEMTLHDAAMYHFSQWWKRTIRGGYAFALGASLHGAPPERHWVAESRRAWLWGLWIPLGIVAIAATLGGAFVGLFVIYPIQLVRLALGGKLAARQNWWRAAALVVGKFPEMIGEVKFVFDRQRKVKPRLIEYK